MRIPSEADQLIGAILALIASLLVISLGIPSEVDSGKIVVEHVEDTMELQTDSPAYQISKNSTSIFGILEIVLWISVISGILVPILKFLISHLASNTLGLRF